MEQFTDSQSVTAWGQNLTAQLRRPSRSRHPDFFEVSARQHEWSMSSQTKSSQMMRKGARVVATELLREPVKEAVREALREETSSVRSTSDGIEASTASKSEPSEEWSSRDSSQTDYDRSSSGGGRSKLATAGLILAVVGITYLARRRMSSTVGSAWSEPSPGSVASDDAESGYVSEGEMQTAETADEGGADSEGPGTSPSTTTDR